MQFCVLSLLGGVGTGGWSSAKSHSPWVLTWALFYLPSPPTYGHLLWEVTERIRSQIQV